MLLPSPFQSAPGFKQEFNRTKSERHWFYITSGDSLRKPCVSVPNLETQAAGSGKTEDAALHRV